MSSEHPHQPKEHIERLKEHLQQLKNAGFKVIADCESLSIEASSRPSPALIDCAICPNPSLRNEQFRSKLENQRKMYEARITEAARKAREEYADGVKTVLNQKSKMAYEDGDMIRGSAMADAAIVCESLRQQAGDP